MQNTKTLLILALVTAAVSVAFVTIARDALGRKEAVPGEGFACTMDAKLCPDGSYVGRIAPTCEFAVCPGL